MTKRQTAKLISAIVTLILLAVIGDGVRQTGTVTVPKLKTATTVPPGYYAVTHVTDGDTFSVSIAGKSESVRMIGIDTPETKDPRTTVQCFGVAASQHTHELLDGKNVRLEGDPQSDDRDKYHRLLRYVYLPDGSFVNQNIVEQGYGFAYTLFPNSKLEDFRGWERTARENNRGLWAGCNVNDSSQKKQTTSPK